MAVRRTTANDQLDLFSNQRPTYESIDTIRPPGRETLARTLPKNGERTGGAGTVARDVAGGRREDEGRNDRPDATVQKTGADRAAGTRPGVGNGAGNLHPVTRRDLADDSPKNLNSYRITDDDRLGEGSPKQ